MENDNRLICFIIPYHNEKSEENDIEHFSHGEYLSGSSFEIDALIINPIL